MTSRGIPWTKLLGESGLELDGYQKTLKDCRESPWVPPGKRKAKSKSKKKAGGRAKYPSAKHGSD